MKKNIFFGIMLYLFFGYSGNVAGQSGGIWSFNDGADPTADILGTANNGNLLSGVAFQTINPSPAGGKYLHSERPVAPCCSYLSTGKWRHAGMGR